MYIMTQNNKNEKFFDMVSLLEHEHEEILIDLSKLENLVWEFSSKDVDLKLYNEIKELVAGIYKRLLFNFRLEEDVLFPDLHEVLPAQSSIPAMRVEHTEIHELCDLISELLRTKDIMESNKEKIEAEIITLVDHVERSFHKKENVMYHEAEAKISESRLEELYKRMLEKVNLSAA
jgi:hemerythrin-like domain-containing protein